MPGSEPTPEDLALLDAARTVREHAHAPLSGSRVGAALRTADGHVQTGCNVEDILLSLGVCAERTAIYKAISEGHRAFTTIAVVTDSSPPAAPCGVCRQLLSTWKVERIVIGNVQGEVEVVALDELLPRRFHLAAPVR